MRICLVAHGFPPYECTGVEGYTSALAQGLAAAGHTVEVFAPRRAPDLPHLSMRREERDGFGLTWITTNVEPTNPKEMLDLPGVAVRFGDHLDREQPELIHFQHLIKLGLDLLEEAKSRHIPCVYTAHDYYAVCHRVTLMRPDMQRCEVLGDAQACARCDLGLAFLNQFEELGDYQLGALQSQLPAKAWKQLAGILQGKPKAAGFSEEDQRALLEARRELDERRRKVYSSIDLILSPTRFLKDRLVEGGLPEEKIELLTYGAETRDLADLPRSARRPGEPIRFGYLGGLAKQKGVHVLLEAFEELGEEASLAIYGASSDAAYVKTIKDEAKRVGAQWMGSFERPQLRAALAKVDVVVVPSIWVENFPFVIREALAAGRPVITSDVGALPESIADGKDGLLFAPGDAKQLAKAMRRFIDEPQLLEQLVEGIGPIKSIEEQVDELIEIYASLIDRVEPEQGPDLPRSLRAWEQRYAELSRLPQRELFRRVLDHLPHMGQVLRGKGEKRANTPLPSDALANYSKAQMLLRDLKRERVWLKSSVEDHQQADKALRERVSWREEELDVSKQQVLWLNKTVTQREEEGHWLKTTLKQKEKENNWLRETLNGREEELQWLRDSIEADQAKLKANDEELAWLRESLDARKAELKAMEEELAWVRQSLEAKQEELGAAAKERTAHEEELQWVRESLESKSKEADWLRQTLEDLKSRHAHDLFKLDVHMKASEEEMQRRVERTTELLQASEHKVEETSERLREIEHQVEATSEQLQAKEQQLDQTSKTLLTTQERLAQRIEHLLATEEQLGLTAEMLRQRNREMQEVSLAAKRHLLVRHTAVGKRAAQWTTPEPQDPGEGGAQ